MYCSKCGKEIHNDAKFCIYCGNKIKKNTPDHSKYEKFDYAPVVLRAEQGDEEAFTTLWAKTNQPYRYYIYLQSKNKDAVDDILQESYRRIFKDIMEKKLQNPEAFFSWGKRIVLNTTADHYRKYKYETQEEKVSESSDDENDIKDFYKEDYATDFNPEAQITQNEVSDILQDIIGELPESQKNCILLWMDEYKTDEIAEILGMSSGTVKSNVNYAKKKIKTKVEDLEKQGVKLYSMAPFTFFVWLMAQFDQNAASAVPSMGNAVLFEQIMKQVHTIATTASGGSISGQVGNKLNETTSQSLEDAKQAVSQNSGQIASSTSDVRTQPAGQMQNNSVNSEAFSHADNATDMAQNAIGTAVKKRFISTVTGKILIGTAAVLVIIGGTLGALHQKAADESNSALSKQHETSHKQSLDTENTKESTSKEEKNNKNNYKDVYQYLAHYGYNKINVTNFTAPFIFTDSSVTGINLQDCPTGIIGALYQDINDDGSDEVVCVNLAGYIEQDELNKGLNNNNNENINGGIKIQVFVITNVDKEKPIINSWEYLIYDEELFNFRLDVFMDKNNNIYFEGYEGNAVLSQILNTNVSTNNLWTLSAIHYDDKKLSFIDINKNNENDVGFHMTWNPKECIIINNEYGVSVSSIESAGPDAEKNAQAMKSVLYNLDSLPFKVNAIGRDNYESIINQNPNSVTPIARISTEFNGYVGQKLSNTSELSLEFENLTTSK